MGLIDKLNSKIREDEKTFGGRIDNHMMRTGFAVLDYLNGQIITKDDGHQETALGIAAGKYMMIVGNAGSGKSSLAIQLATNIMKKYDDSSMYILDYENSHSEARIRGLTGMSEDYYRDHVTIKNKGIYSETLLALVTEIHKIKTELKDEIMVDNADGEYTSDGKLKKILPPTFIIIDSFKVMQPEATANSEKIEGNSYSGRNAILNSQLLTKLVQPCLESNIVLIIINHITTNVSIGVMPPKSITKYLSNTENIPGGKSLIFLSNLIIKVDPGKKLEEKDGFHIKGFEERMTVIKSRDTEAGNQATFIFNQKEGFDDDLSSFIFLKNAGAIQGGGVGMYLDGLESVKFRMSNLKEKLAAVPEFRKRFDELKTEYLASSVRISSKVKEQIEENNADAIQEEAVADSDNE